jgi:hypothetical protein
LPELLLVVSKGAKAYSVVMYDGGGLPYARIAAARLNAGCKFDSAMKAESLKAVLVERCIVEFAVEGADVNKCAERGTTAKDMAKVRIMAKLR